MIRHLLNNKLDISNDFIINFNKKPLNEIINNLKEVFNLYEEKSFDLYKDELFDLLDMFLKDDKLSDEIKKYSLKLFQISKTIKQEKQGYLKALAHMALIIIDRKSIISMLEYLDKYVLNFTKDYDVYIAQRLKHYQILIK